VSEDQGPGTRPPPASGAGRPSTLDRFALIGVIVAGVAGAFAYTGGWIGPARLKPKTIINALEANAGGRHPGWRRAHAKGVCVTGYFDGNGAGRFLSSAQAFGKLRTPVVGRFALAGGDPFAGDGRVVFHSMALSLTQPDGEIWRIGMDHTPIFPVSTPQAFTQLQIAGTPDPKTGKPDPAKMKALLAAHPEIAAYLKFMKAWPLPDSFAAGDYYSINAFRFVDGQGQARLVRWAMVPEQTGGVLDKDKLKTVPDNLLFDELRTRLAKGPLHWRMVVTLAGPDDAVDDATKQWSGADQQVEVGTLTLNATQPEEVGGCRDITYDPTILPKGIAISDDPLLPARSAAYSKSFARRAAEGPHPGAQASAPPSVPAGAAQ